MNNSEENTKKAGKTVFIILLVVVVSMLVVSIGSNFFKKHLAVSNAETLASYAETEFLDNDFNTYLEYLGIVCGLDDLTGECKFHFDFDRDYEPESQTLHLHGGISLNSDKIDNYYADESESDNVNELYSLLRKLSTSGSKTYKYSYSEGNVKVDVGFKSKDFDVKTSSGRIYNYSTYVDELVEIDGNRIYKPQKKQSTIENAKKCEVCDKSGSYELEGFDGNTEYYCYEHYKEMEDIVGKILSKGNNATKSTTMTGEKNALKSAKAYLDYTAFSYTGLIEQLEYEGYSHTEAVYGADNCGADWNEQAAKSAANYLDYTSFSRSGLIEQLEYEGFTHSQAVYGVEQNGY